MTCGNTQLELSFVSVGPQRTGSTWLYEMLLQHPGLCVPEAVKETMFFDRRYGRGLSWYAQYFEHCGDDQLCGEVAPTYFDAPQVPERIHSLWPECLVVVGLRHPAERAFSLYLHHLRKGRVSGSFREAIEQKPRIVMSGKYATHVPKWQSAFGEEQVDWIFLDDIKSRPHDVVEHFCQRLDVEPIDTLTGTEEKVNAASLPRFPSLGRAAAYLTTRLHAHGLHRVVEWGKKLGLRRLAYAGGEDEMPELTDPDRQRLVELYREDIAFVEEMTGRDLSYWRR